MKKIQLVKLVLSNFKGVKDFTFNPNGSNAAIFGKNEAGKTTVPDAFLWLLFDKDSKNKGAGGKSGFAIKTLDEDNKVIHHLDHMVEGTFLIDGNERVFKKTYKEVWRTISGQVEQTLTGHTTDHYIDGVPTIQREYKAEIASLVDEKVFRMITDSSHFNEVLNETEKRETLLEIAGDISDERVLESDEEFKPLIEELNGRTVEKQKAKVTAERTAVRTRLKLIPELIKENQLNVPDLTGLNADTIKSTIDKLSLDIEEKQGEINDIRNGSKTNEIKTKISDLKLEISNVKNEHTQNEQQEVFKLQAKLQEEESNLAILRNDVRNEMSVKNNRETLLEHKESELKKVNTEGKSLSQTEFEGEHNCPTCKQDLPAEKVEEATASFNLNKSEKLAALRVSGKGLLNEIESIKSEIENVTTKIEKATKNGELKAAAVEKVKKEYEQAKSTVKPIEENEKYIKLNKDIDALNVEITTLEQSTEESIQSVIKSVAPLEIKKNELQADLKTIEQSKTIKERIMALEEEQQKRAAEDGKLAQQLHLIDLFTRKKVSMLEENINDKFQYARFKLFDVLVSTGEVTDTCQTLYKGVPYSAGLNDGAKVNIGLDIANTLSKHYGVQAPIFVDNAESVTDWFVNVESQLITLSASEKDKELRVEMTEESEVA